MVIICTLCRPGIIRNIQTYIQSKIPLFCVQNPVRYTLNALLVRKVRSSICRMLWTAILSSTKRKPQNNIPQTHRVCKTVQKQHNVGPGPLRTPGSGPFGSPSACGRNPYVVYGCKQSQDAHMSNVVDGSSIINRKKAIGQYPPDPYSTQNSPKAV